MTPDSLQRSQRPEHDPHVRVPIFSHREIVYTHNGDDTVTFTIGNRTYLMTVDTFKRVAERFTEIAGEL